MPKGRQYFVHIPDLYVEAIAKALKLSNPTLEEVALITQHATAGILSSYCLEDSLSDHKSTRKLLKHMTWELSEYEKDLKKGLKKEE